MLNIVKLPGSTSPKTNMDTQKKMVWKRWTPLKTWPCLVSTEYVRFLGSISWES